jgi:hypothetical protein
MIKSKKSYLFTFLQCFCFLSIYGQEANFTKEQVISDVEFLELSLLKYHPNLFVYSSKQEIDSCFNELKESISDSNSRNEAFRLISSASSIVKDGHFAIQPDKITIKNFYSNAKLFPLDLYWINDDAFIIKNYTKDNIGIGDKVLSINGMGIHEIRRTILGGALRDGYNTTYPNWILNNFNRAYHGFYFGNSEIYEIEILKESGLIEKKQIKGLTYAEISNSRKISYPAYYKQLNEEKGIEFKIDSVTKSALLTIKSFENSILKKTYHQNFKKSVKSAFKTLDQQGISELIIDLRGNQGGEVRNGIFLLKYLLNESFQAVQGFTIVDKKQYDSEQNRNKSVKGIGTKYLKPFEQNYTGNLYVLIDGGSFSCSGIFSWVLKKKKRGIIIGNESGGSAYTLVGAPNKTIILPNTKLQVTIPLLQYILQDYKDETKSGVVPDVVINPTIYDMINGTDCEYNHALELIKKQ